MRGIWGAFHRESRALPWFPLRALHYGPLEGSEEVAVIAARDPQFNIARVIAAVSSLPWVGRALATCCYGLEHARDRSMPKGMGVGRGQGRPMHLSNSSGSIREVVERCS